MIDSCINGNEATGSITEAGISREKDKILTSVKGVASWNLLIRWNKYSKAVNQKLTGRETVVPRSSISLPRAHTVFDPQPLPCKSFVNYCS